METGSTTTASATTHSRATRDFLKPREWPAFGGLYMRALNLCTRAIAVGADFGGFVSGLKIRLPGNRDRREQRPVRHRTLLREEAQHLVLARPFGWQIAKTDDAHSTRQSTYTRDALPNETTLRTDLQNVVRAYRALTFRGGIEGDVEPQAELEDEFKIPAQATVIETRKYAFHRKVERNRTAAKQAKKFHGTVCQACDLDFEKRYGATGKGFIEAHHLKAISTLEEGVAVTYDVAADFAVLCANCHRMIHRSEDPSDLNKFREMVQSIKS